MINRRGPSTRYLDRFELLRQLRVDAPYEHWLARDAGTGASVELSLAPAEQYREALPTLAPSARTCPQLLPFLQRGILNDQHYTVVPHRRGTGALMEYCRPDRLLPEDQIVRLFIELTQALIKLHSMQTHFGTVTPGSILVQAAPDSSVNLPRIGGYVRLRVCTGGVDPDPYSAPEVLAGNPPTAASDLYSLGATLFVALTGRLPNSQRQRQSDESGKKWPPVRQFRADVPPLLERVTNKALQPNPRSRYRNLVEFAGDLSLLVDCPSESSTEISPRGIFLAARTLACFNGLGDRELWEIVHACHWRNFTADTVVAADTRDGHGLYAVVAGSVAQFDQGRLVANLSQGACFGSHYLLRDEPPPVTYYASAGTTVITVSAAAIEQMTNACQIGIHNYLLKQLSSQLRKATQRASC